MASYRTARAKSLVKRETPHCNPDGTFQQIQCDEDERRSECFTRWVRSLPFQHYINTCLRQCWCVDINSGEEVHGTRTSSISEHPDCNGLFLEILISAHRFSPKECRTRCASSKCTHGVRLNRNGCPLNDRCECKNPCEDMKCSVPSDICVLKKVECLTQPCPAVPICIRNPCAGGLRALNNTQGNTLMCANDQDCVSGKCSLLEELNNIGVCCPLGISCSNCFIALSYLLFSRHTSTLYCKGIFSYRVLYRSLPESFMGIFHGTVKYGECPMHLRHRYKDSLSTGFLTWNEAIRHLRFVAVFWATAVLAPVGAANKCRPLKSTPSFGAVTVRNLNGYAERSAPEWRHRNDETKTSFPKLRN
ncbi:unnamed protein product [Anisakis simplex]|uniref:Thyroglobulin type-1 domain-containing protein n=1 Tax=Anisakis simplex TaxID=6269 RepID=A0A0M3K7D9_ANISI|nr:unnamed protein product [Anisakis simplex]